MPRLTTKQKFALTFTVYVFSFLVVLYSIFFILFSIMINYQLKVELSQDTDEVINNHLLVDNGQIIFRKDQTGASLKEFLANENASAIITKADGSIIRSYGQFTFDQADPNNFKTLLIPQVIKVQKTKIPFGEGLTWNKQRLQITIVPLQSHGQVVGTLVLGKSTAYLDGLKSAMMTVFSTLGLFSLIGSFALGYALSRRTLNPMIRLAKMIESMDVEKLDKKIETEDNSQDEIKYLIDKFNEMIVQVKDMTVRQKAFISNASHELKTPLTRAITSLEVLPQDLKTNEEIRLIRDDLFYLDTLLENLLFLTQLKRNELTVAKIKKINLEKMFKNLKKYFSGKLNDKNISLKISSPDTIATILSSEYLEIILTNLISNSIKYSLPEKTVSVTIKTADVKNIIEIKDEGIGMTAEESSHMFDRFYRGKSTVNKEHGYGIGLSIVKQICDIYGIKIKVKSEKGKGTTITLS